MSIDTGAVAPPADRTDGLRIAVLSDAAPDRNGVGAYYADLLEHLRTRVARAEMYSPLSGSKQPRELFSFPMPGDGTQRIAMPRPRLLGRELEALAPHVIIVPSPGPYGLLGLRAARRLGAALVVGFHTNLDMLADLYWNRLFGWVCRSYLENSHRLLFRYADEVLANSEEMQRIALSIGARDVELMGTTIPRLFLDTPLTDCGPEVHSVLFAGRLAAEKNLQAVIDAARNLPALRFRIAGEGPQAGLVRDAAAELDNLDYLGWRSREQLMQAIDDNDMLVLPSHVESFGTVALEAMTRRRTVLVSRHCGIVDWDALSPGLFRIAEGETLAAAIARVASLDAAVRRQKAQLARDGACRLNEWSLDHWLTLLGRHAGTP